MPRYFRQDISADTSVPKPSPDPLLGTRLARRAPLVAQLRGQDRVVTQSRRVVLRQGLSGAAEWLVPNTDPDSMSIRHPYRDAARVAARGRFILTPGCMLELKAIVALTGQTQRDSTAAEIALGANLYSPGGVSGSLRLTCNWDDGGATLTRSHTVALPPSLRPFGAAPTAQGGQFAELRTVRIPLVFPQDLASTTTLRRWCQPTTVTLRLDHIGGARVVDCVVVEKPYAVAMEADDAVWTSHVYGQTPGGQGPLSDYPYQRLSETTPDGNPRGGSWHTQDVAANQAERLGACLLSWTTWDEDDEAVRATEAAPREFTSTSFAGLANSSLTAYSDTQEGWSLAAGAYCRTRRLNDPVGMPNNGVIPVRVRVYCEGTATGGNSAGVIRFQSGPWEWVDATVSSGAAAGWVTAWGHARVGRGPGDHAVGQVFARRTGGSGGIRVWAVEVHHNDRVARVL